MPRKRRTFSIDFKKKVVAEYLGGETLHRVARRHGIDLGLLRIWVEKAENSIFQRLAAHQPLDRANASLVGGHQLGRRGLAVELPGFKRGLACETLAWKCRISLVTCEISSPMASLIPFLT